ncbi:uncharacterized protein [Rutidosis leptorrhynchoides]|uniref:uncharacterized protein n=1 Tax=Rutidosis leptorrhynchoides TaxID=125765 RepID=UPI003A99A7F6
MENSKNSPSAEDLLRRILELEEHHAQIKSKTSKLLLDSANRKPANSRPPPVSSSFRLVDIETPAGGFMEPLAMMLREAQYLNIMQSMDQGIHIYDLNHRVIFWNRAAEKMYGYTAAEVYGRSPVDVLVEPKDKQAANFVLERALNGESWSGAFPIKNKHGETFVIVVANTPYRDENNRIVGAMSICSDSRQFEVMEVEMSITVPTTFTFDIESQQNMKTSIVSNSSILWVLIFVKGFVGSEMSWCVMGRKCQGDADVSANLSYEPRPRNGRIYLQVNSRDHVKLKMQTEDYYTDSESGTEITDPSQSSTLTGDIVRSHFEHFFTLDIDDHFTVRSENKLGIHRILFKKAKAWMGKKGISRPWQLTERNDESLDAKLGHLCLCPINVNQEPEAGPKISSSPSAKADRTLSTSNDLNITKFEATRLWISTSHITSTSSDVDSIKCNTIDKFEDYEILWADLFIKEWIGEGSLGTVYNGLWYGSDVAVTLFAYQMFSDDIIVLLKQEISVLKRLRHSNVLLYIGVVTSPPHLCIVTEFLPRGSLFQILHKSTIRFDWRHRLQMTVDIAEGMNYLHQCNPPIVHSNLNSSCLLVDKNWSVKVGDIGLSRIKRPMYIKIEIWKRAPQWMAPEVLRNEQADEKSDVYSYGVVLWELATERVPWDGLNAMQVVGTVGFMNRRLEIPKDVDPQLASLIESCLCREPQCRPSFQEILCNLKDLQKKFV